MVALLKPYGAALRQILYDVYMTYLIAFFLFLNHHIIQAAQAVLFPLTGSWKDFRRRNEAEADGKRGIMMSLDIHFFDCV